MEYEFMALNQIFDTDRATIQKLINYYCAIHLDGQDEKSPFGIHISDIDRLVESQGEHLGVDLTIQFIWEGNRQH